MDEQGFCADEVIAVEQGFDDQCVSFRGVEEGCVRRPEFQISGGSTSAMPEPKCSGDQLRGLEGYFWIGRVDVADFVRCILTPPFRHLAEFLFGGIA